MAGIGPDAEAMLAIGAEGRWVAPRFWSVASVRQRRSRFLWQQPRHRQGVHHPLAPDRPQRRRLNRILPITNGVVPCQPGVARSGTPGTRQDHAKNVGVNPLGFRWGRGTAVVLGRAVSPTPSPVVRVPPRPRPLLPQISLGARGARPIGGSPVMNGGSPEKWVHHPYDRWHHPYEKWMRHPWYGGDRLDRRALVDTHQLLSEVVSLEQSDEGGW